jgi:hypothetical protein
MPGRLTRFLNLEKRRPPSQEPPHELATKARFEGDAPSEIGLAFDFGEQPFLRCPACEADNNKQAEKCFNCQRPLLGDEVRAWNAAFWQRRKLEPPADASAAAAPLSDETRRLAEQLAAQVAERERARLWSWKSADARDSMLPGLRLLGLIADGDKRMLATLAAGATFLVAALVAVTATQHPLLRGMAAAIAVLLLALFVPSTRGPRWWE